MKKMNEILRYGMITLGLVTSFLFQSCDSESYDVEGETQNFVYMNLQEWAPANYPKNTFLFSVFRTPVSSTLVSGANVRLSVQCTKPASEDIKVAFEIDRTVRMEGYTSFPEDFSVTMDKTELIIPQGEMVSSEQITVIMEEDKWNLFKENVYLLPIKITSVSNAELSQTLYSTYIAVKTDYSNCVSGATTVPGTKIMDRGTWTATVNGDNAGLNIPNLFDGVSNTYASFAAGTFEVDLQKVYSSVSGMQFNFSSATYAMTAATIYTSATGKDDYEWQGSISIARAALESIQFYGPVNVRYIKIQMTDYNSRGLRPTEFNVFQKTN